LTTRLSASERWIPMIGEHSTFVWRARARYSWSSYSSLPSGLRSQRPNGLKNKDALDVLRILRAIPIGHGGRPAASSSRFPFRRSKARSACPSRQALRIGIRRRDRNGDSRDRAARRAECHPPFDARRSCGPAPSVRRSGHWNTLVLRTTGSSCPSGLPTLMCVGGGSASLLQSRGWRCCERLVVTERPRRQETLRLITK
jgi:hypothetical protein